MQTWVQYVVTDACGNSTRCRIEYYTVDRLDPVAILRSAYSSLHKRRSKGVGQTVCYSISRNQGQLRSGAELDSNGDSQNA